MTERTRILAPNRMAVAVGRAFGRKLYTLVVVERESRGKTTELASYLQDYKDLFSR